jgi:isopenicillin N synthase-like dioxygenase
MLKFNPEMQLPVVDLSLEHEQLTQVIRESCENYGFFYLENHGISILSEVYHESQAFFNLPLEMKMQSKCNTSNLGYTTYQDETLSPYQTCGDTKEGYYIGSEFDNNIWPNESILPNWKGVMNRYHTDLCNLGYQLVTLIIKALDLNFDSLSDFFSNPTALVRLIKYGREKSYPDIGILGAGAHSDYGMITLLSTNEVPGLEIYLNETWIPVPPRPHAYIVNLGDCKFEIYTKRCF